MARKKASEDLFGSAVGSGPNSNLPAPTAPTDEVLKLAEALPTRLRLGCSSWSMPGWAAEGLIYDPAFPHTETLLAREGLAAYAAHPLFSTVSIDKTFYSPVKEGEFARLAAQVADDFRFTAKAWRGFTDPQDPKGQPQSSFLDHGRAADEMLWPFATGMGEKAGVLVFQFSPGLPERMDATPRAAAERIAGFLARLPKTPVAVAVEIRDASFVTPAFRQGLEEAGAVPCLTVHPNLPDLVTQARAFGTPEPFVLRWMLHPAWTYKEGEEAFAPYDRLVAPDPATRAAAARLLSLATARGRNAYAILNNKAEGSSPRTAVALAQAIVAGRRPGTSEAAL